MRGIEPPSPTWKEGVITIIRHLQSVVEDIIPVVTTRFTHFAESTGIEPVTLP
jgi:hypothetical protein